jgi:hypothetical protein
MARRRIPAATWADFAVQDLGGLPPEPWRRQIDIDLRERRLLG